MPDQVKATESPPSKSNASNKMTNACSLIALIMSSASLYLQNKSSRQAIQSQYESLEYSTAIEIKGKLVNAYSRINRNQHDKAMYFKMIDFLERQVEECGKGCSTESIDQLDFIMKSFSDKFTEDFNNAEEFGEAIQITRSMLKLDESKLVCEYAAVSENPAYEFNRYKQASDQFRKGKIEFGQLNNAIGTFFAPLRPIEGCIEYDELLADVDEHLKSLKERGLEI